MTNDNFKTAAKLTRACKTKHQLKRREKANMNCYNNGVLTVKEYGKLSVIEMEVAAKLNLNTL